MKHVARLVSSLGIACALLGCRDLENVDGATPPPCGSAPSNASPSKAGSTASLGSASLVFDFEGKTSSLTLDELVARVPPREIEVDDPYYRTKKHYRAMPLVAVLERGFGKPADELRRAHFVLEAKDGYQTEVSGDRLIAPEVFVAIADLDAGAWQPIGPRGADPGPLYVVWTGAGHGNTDIYPHPWALGRILAQKAPPDLGLTVPRGGFGNDALAAEGHGLFVRRCLHCHSVQKQGGKLGPDLDAPRNVLDYRKERDVRAYISNPESFRYSAMLPNPDLDEHALDSLIAYLRALERQHRSPTKP